MSPARLRSVQPGGAVRSASARRWRLHGQRALQRQARQVLGARQQPAHLRAGLRDDLAGLQRPRHQHQRADAERDAAPGRHEHRTARHRLLRRARPDSGADRRILHGQRGDGLQPGESVLPRRAGHDDAVHERGQLRRFRRSTSCCRGTFQSSPAEPLQANWTVSSAIVAQTLGRPLSGGRAERDRQPAGSGSDARAARESTRSAHRQGTPLRHRSAPPSPWTCSTR